MSAKPLPVRKYRTARSQTKFTIVGSGSIDTASKTAQGVWAARKDKLWQFHLDDNAATYTQAFRREKISRVEALPPVVQSPATNVPKSVLRRNIYAALHEVLGRMGQLDPSDPHFVDDQTLDTAGRVLNIASQYQFEPPRVMSHGGDAVTFTWKDDVIGRYLTLSGDEAQQLDINTETKVKCKYDVLLDDPQKREEWLAMFGGEPTATSVIDDAH